MNARIRAQDMPRLDAGTAIVAATRTASALGEHPRTVLPVHVDVDDGVLP